MSLSHLPEKSSCLKNPPIKINLRLRYLKLELQKQNDLYIQMFSQCQKHLSLKSFRLLESDYLYSLLLLLAYLKNDSVTVFCTQFSQDFVFSYFFHFLKCPFIVCTTLKSSSRVFLFIENAFFVAFLSCELKKDPYL